MPNVKSAIKRVRTNEKRRARNRRDRARLRTALKRASELEGDKRSEENVQQAMSLLDRSARKGLIHPNKAARAKSRLARSRAKPREGSST